MIKKKKNCERVKLILSLRASKLLYYFKKLKRPKYPWVIGIIFFYSRVKSVIYYEKDQFNHIQSIKDNCIVVKKKNHITFNV